jgi:hypothetical protein
MNRLPRATLPVLAILFAAGCASVPSSGDRSPAEGFLPVHDQPHYQVRVRAGEAAWPAPPVFRMPQASIKEGASDAGINASQAEVVANHAARSVCLALAPWVQWSSAEEGGRISLEVQRIAASSSGLATTSAVIDAVVPGPFRLPAGLGALEVNTRVEDASGAPLLEMRWARGANPLLHRARASPIGDAWELAPSLSRDLRDALKPRLGSQLPASERSANVAACEQRFGKVNTAGRAASMFIPLSPEAIDPSDNKPADMKPADGKASDGAPPATVPPADKP